MSKPDDWRTTPAKPISNPADQVYPAKEHA
jgi:hypothetical protein